MSVRLILASASPRRKELLQFIRIPFKVVLSNVEEINNKDLDPEHLVLKNAELKANDILVNYPQELVLAADTVVALDNEILNKPRDLAEAKEMLLRLSDREHSVYTGICLKSKSIHLDIRHCEVSQVRFLKLSEAVIDRYFSLVNPLDKAGAYAIQEHPEYIIKGYKGHMSNIMGLPIEFLHSLFHKIRLLSWD